MELFNSTPLAARVDVGAEAANGLRRGILVAKATFRILEGGQSDLEREDPHPIYIGDRLTPVGLLPRDDMPRTDPAFEVSLLGRAHAPNGRPTREVRVSLRVGEVCQSVDVLGDRRFIGEGPTAVISEPEPFMTMPLTWSRAFGGNCDLEVDEGSVVEVTHPLNSFGKGFNPSSVAEGLDRTLACPPGYPRYPTLRVLPNLERPDQRIRGWADNPEPISFAPPPAESGVHNRRCYRVVEDEAGRPRVEMSEGAYHRAAPEWVLDKPLAKGAVVEMIGVSPDGPLSFRWPDLRVHFDYVLGERTGSFPLEPHALVLLPEERRFYVVFRLPFFVAPPDGSERSGRLRIEQGDVT